MKPNDVVYSLLKDTNTTQGALAHLIGKASAAAVSNRLNRNAMGVDAFVEMVNALGYEIVVRSKEPTDVRTEYIVTNK